MNLYTLRLILIPWLYMYAYNPLTFFQILNPFYIFQICSVILWSLDDYYYYAGCIVLISAISMGVELYETRQVSHQNTQWLSHMRKLVYIYICYISIAMNYTFYYLQQSQTLRDMVSAVETTVTVLRNSGGTYIMFWFWLHKTVHIKPEHQVMLSPALFSPGSPERNSFHNVSACIWLSFYDRFLIWLHSKRTPHYFVFAQLTLRR